jgi:hypothetical protein
METIAPLLFPQEEKDFVEKPLHLLFVKQPLIVSVQNKIVASTKKKVWHSVSVSITLGTKKTKKRIKRWQQ